jgi:DNA recombination protein Rad52
LNEVFGFDGWNLEIKQTTREECVKDEKGRFHVAYTATVRLTHRRSGAYKEDCGAGDAIDRSMGTAIAHGLKASITDAMKRAARHFGDKLGNSLYQGGFTFNKAPMTLKQALDQYDINRANTKFGVQPNPANPVGMKSEAVVKSETPPVPPANQHTTNAGPPKQPVSAQKHAANAYPKKTMPPATAQTYQERAIISNVTTASRPLAPMQTKVSPYPMKTPKAGPSAVPLVTPHTSNAPPTPGQRLQSGQLFGLGQYAAGKPSFSFDGDSENQPPASADAKRPGTSTGLQEQRAGVGPFAGRQPPGGGVNKRPLEHVVNQHVPQKKANVAQAMPVQKRNPYASS